MATLTTNISFKGEKWDFITIILYYRLNYKFMLKIDKMNFIIFTKIVPAVALTIFLVWDFLMNYFEFKYKFDKEFPARYQKVPIIAAYLYSGFWT